MARFKNVDLDLDKNFLQQVVQDKYSNVETERSKLQLTLHQFHLLDVNNSLKEYFNRRVAKYDSRLNGLLLGCENIKVLSKTGTIMLASSSISSHAMHVNIEAEFYIFRPTVGAELKGTINKKSDTHLGCLVHKVFNVTLPRPEDCEEWIGDSIQIGQEIIFKVDFTNLTAKLPYICGSVLRCLEFDSGFSTSEEGNVPKKKKHIHFDATSDINETNAGSDVATNSFKKKKKSNTVDSLMEDNNTVEKKKKKSKQNMSLDVIDSASYVEDESPRKKGKNNSEADITAEDSPKKKKTKSRDVADDSELELSGTVPAFPKQHKKKEKEIKHAKKLQHSAVLQELKFDNVQTSPKKSKKIKKERLESDIIKESPPVKMNKSNYDKNVSEEDYERNKGEQSYTDTDDLKKKLLEQNLLRMRIGESTKTAHSGMDEEDTQLSEGAYTLKKSKKAKEKEFNSGILQGSQRSYKSNMNEKTYDSDSSEEDTQPTKLKNELPVKNVLKEKKKVSQQSEDQHSNLEKLKGASKIKMNKQKYDSDSSEEDAKNMSDTRYNYTNDSKNKLVEHSLHKGNKLPKIKGTKKMSIHNSVSEEDASTSKPGKSYDSDSSEEESSRNYNDIIKDLLEQSLHKMKDSLKIEKTKSHKNFHELAKMRKEISEIDSSEEELHASDKSKKNKERKSNSDTLQGTSLSKKAKVTKKSYDSDSSEEENSRNMNDRSYNDIKKELLEQSLHRINDSIKIKQTKKGSTHSDINEEDIQSDKLKNKLPNKRKEEIPNEEELHNPNKSRKNKEKQSNSKVVLEKQLPKKSKINKKSSASDSSEEEEGSKSESMNDKKYDINDIKKKLLEQSLHKITKRVSVKKEIYTSSDTSEEEMNSIKQNKSIDSVAIKHELLNQSINKMKGETKKAKSTKESSSSDSSSAEVSRPRSKKKSDENSYTPIINSDVKNRRSEVEKDVKGKKRKMHSDSFAIENQQRKAKSKKEKRGYRSMSDEDTSYSKILENMKKATLDKVKAELFSDESGR